MRNARIYMRNPEFPWASIAKQIKPGVGSERTFTWVLESSGLWTQGEQALPWPLSVGSWGNVASFYNFRSLVKKCPFSLFKKIIYFNWRILYLQYCGGFCHTLTWITHGYTCVSPSWTLSHLPLYSIPLGYHQLQAMNSHWSSILHMAIYLFQCYSLKSSLPHLLPYSPKVCSLFLCLFCCLAYRIIVTVLRKGKLPTLLVGMQTGTATMENRVEITLKTGNRTAIRPRNPTAGHTHHGNQNRKRHMYPSVHCSTVYNSQDMEVI